MAPLRFEVARFESDFVRRATSIIVCSLRPTAPIENSVRSNEKLRSNVSSGA